MICLKDYGIEPLATFDCGQCFRWQKDDDGNYFGVAGGRVGIIKDGVLDCDSADEPFWREYFCLDMDYKNLQRELIKRDKTLDKCIEYGRGIRLLNQDLWETTVSFIISANNNIPRIRRIVEQLCTQFGDKIELKGREYYEFPTAKRLAELECEDLSELKAGYRDRYIIDAARKFASGEISAEKLEEMSTDEARKSLMSIVGVGRKVADCILLFALRRYEVFPRDVWINRVMENVYSVNAKESLSFAEERYKELAGLAQQYLFYYYRDNN